MQNHNTVNTSEFVSLEQGWNGWRCRQCGCQNDRCDRCRQCGWSWPCNTGCVRGNAEAVNAAKSANVNVACTYQAKDCESKANASCGSWAANTCTGCGGCTNACGCSKCTADAACTDCSACAQTTRNTAACEACPVENLPRYVQPCPDNTTLRNTGCGNMTNQSRMAWNGNACTDHQQSMNTACAPCQASKPCDACTCNTCQVDQPCATVQCNPCSTCSTSKPCASAACPTGAACQVRTACPCNDGCGTASTATAAEKARNRAAGMVYAAKQKLDQVFNAESALRTGTLFPELHKPMNGYCPGDCNCATPKQESAFSAWDLRLYLDTHPDDEQAQALFRQMSDEAADPNYATTFLQDDDLPEGWDWTQDPWPWNCRPCGE